MKEDTVENINRDLLMKMIGDYEYLVKNGLKDTVLKKFSKCEVHTLEISEFFCNTDFM